MTRRAIKKRICLRAANCLESDQDTDGFAELVDEVGIDFEEAIRLYQELIDELRRRGLPSFRRSR